MPSTVTQAPATSNVFRIPDFRKLFASSALESVGDEASRTLIPIVAVALLGAGSFEVGLLNALSVAAFLVLGIPVGVWVDRLRKRRILIAADLLRAAAILSLPVAYVMGSLTMWHLLFAVSVIGVADVFFTTAHTTVLPRVVDREQLSMANARLQSAQSTISVGSPVLAGGLLAAVAAPFALLTATAAYLVSAMSLIRLRCADAMPDGGARPPFWASAREGLAFTVAHPILRPLFLSGMVTNAAVMFGNAAAAVYALTVLDLAPALYAGLGVFAAVGGLLGSFTAVPVLNVLGIGKTKILCSVAAAPVVALVPLASVFPGAAVALIAVSGFSWAYLIVVTSIAGSGIMPRVTPGRMLGSVSASNRLFVLGVMPLASVAGGALGAWLGVVPVLWVWTVLAGLSAVPIALSPVRSWKQFPPEYDVG